MDKKPTIEQEQKILGLIDDLRIAIDLDKARKKALKGIEDIRKYEELKIQHSKALNI